MTSLGKLALIFGSVAATLLALWLFSLLGNETILIPPDAELPDGARYYGEIENGKFHGPGKLVWSNGDVFTGQFAEGLASGEGKRSYATGAEYEGHFESGQRSGHGRLKMVDGSVYEGQFLADAFHGEGLLTYHNGDTYIGLFKDNLFHGQGRYTYADSGDSYQGEFLRSAFTGQGVYLDDYGNRYEGEFRNWRFHGRGKYFTRGGVYEGRFEDGNLSGEGSFEGADGTRYEGGFVDWTYHGPGTLLHESGAQTGIWNYGILDQQAAVKEPRDAWVEAALYTQGELLQETLHSLQPSRDRHIDMYFVGVAGWAEQEVFLKEVDFARSQFDRNYDTRGRSITLVNNPATVQERPLATVMGIARTLSFVSSLMDPQEDILFLFLTSHGSEHGGLALEHGALPLSDLSPDRLAEILRGTEIKWKVLVVSACYSGAFIEPLKDDRTLIMTASSDENTSFGCSDEADLTYFGRAYFERSLPSADSFASAFVQARELIYEWESGEEKHSDPQIYRPEPILQHLERWRAQ